MCACRATSPGGRHRPHPGRQTARNRPRASPAITRSSSPPAGNLPGASGRRADDVAGQNNPQAGHNRVRGHRRGPAPHTQPLPPRARGDSGRPLLPQPQFRTCAAANTATSRMRAARSSEGALTERTHQQTIGATAAARPPLPPTAVDLHQTGVGTLQRAAIYVRVGQATNWTRWRSRAR